MRSWMTPAHLQVRLLEEIVSGQGFGLQDDSMCYLHTVPRTEPPPVMIFDTPAAGVMQGPAASSVRILGPTYEQGDLVAQPVAGDLLIEADEGAKSIKPKRER